MLKNPPQSNTLPNPRINQQIPTPLQPQTSLQKRLQRIPLSPQTIDHLRAGFDEGCFEHVREEGEDRVEWFEFAVSAF